MEILYVLPSNEQSPPSFDFVTAYSGGVLAGTSTGVCIMFEKTDDDLLYKKTREFIMEPSGVSTIAVRPSDDSAVCTLKNSQIYSISLDADSSKVRKRSVANLWLPRTLLLNVLFQGEDIKCNRLFQEFHHNQIVGMDVCAKKPIVVTCGMDRSVRIWNYLENTLEVCKVFDDEPQR